jgi:Family of unknown function (DUF5681)
MRRNKPPRPKLEAYKVGYGRPPKATQFAPGKSGNPTGRPKGSRSVEVILAGIIKQKIAVTENGTRRRLPVMEVMLLRLTHAAMRGDQAAIKLLLSLVDRYGGSATDSNATKKMRIRLSIFDEPPPHWVRGHTGMDEVSTSENSVCEGDGGTQSEHDCDS